MLLSLQPEAMVLGKLLAAALAGILQMGAWIAGIVIGCVLGNTLVLGYLPLLLAVSLFTGALTGFVSSLLFRAMDSIKLS